MQYTGCVFDFTWFGQMYKKKKKQLEIFYVCLFTKKKHWKHVTPYKSFRAVIKYAATAASTTTTKSNNDCSHVGYTYRA